MPALSFASGKTLGSFSWEWCDCLAAQGLSLVVPPCLPTLMSTLLAFMLPPHFRRWQCQNWCDPGLLGSVQQWCYPVQGHRRDLLPIPPPHPACPGCHHQCYPNTPSQTRSEPCDKGRSQRDQDIARSPRFPLSQQASSCARWRSSGSRRSGTWWATTWPPSCRAASRWSTATPRTTPPSSTRTSGRISRAPIPSFPPLLGSLLTRIRWPNLAPHPFHPVTKDVPRVFRQPAAYLPSPSPSSFGRTLCSAFPKGLLTDTEDAALGFSWRGCNGCLFKRELNLQIFDATRQSTYKPSILRDF